MHTRNFTIRNLLLVLAALALTVLAMPAPTSAQGPVAGNTPVNGKAPTPAAILQQQCLNAEGARSAYHPATGMIRFIGTQPGRAIRQPGVVAADASPAEAARAFLAHCGTLFGLQDQAHELVVERTKALDRGRSSVRFRQVYTGIPVFGGELIMQLDSVQNLMALTGEILPGIVVNTHASIDTTTARQAALQATAQKYNLSTDQLAASEPRLWIYNPVLIRPEAGPTALVWHVEVTPKTLAPIRELVLIHAQRGNLELSFNQIDTAKNRITYTANNGRTLPGTLVCNESNPNCSGGDSHAVAAHKYAGDTYDFYYANYGRDSIDNAGMTIKSTVHFDRNYDNAFWNGAQMIYGDAFGFPLADDVVAHELTHGVTEYESGLYYYYQSGAINESFSDMWGEFVDLTNGQGNDDASVRWLIGEDVTGWPTGAIRNMKNPPQFGDPDKMTSPHYYTLTCGNYSSSCDNGGVHYNSGVNNKAAYLMTDGDTFNGYTVAGLGIPKVAQIYYQAQTTLLTSGADYGDLYEALYQACLNLVGTSGITSSDCQQVRNATTAVEMNQQPVANYNPEAPVCTSGNVSDLFSDDLESGSGNWSLGQLSGSSQWKYDSPYGSFAHSGSHFLFADDYSTAPSDSYAAMKTSVTLPANAFVHFAHSYGLNDSTGTYYTGGVVEYSTNGGVSWNDAGSLFDYNGYNGKISSSYGNPLGGRSAFVADSHGYVSSRLNLNPLAGQSIRFRWRLGLDASFYDQGWFLDDVRIYTCTNEPGSFGKTSPLNGATGWPTNPALSWSSSAGATGYTFCIDTTNDNACAGGNWTDAGTATSVDLTGLDSGVTYYWHVRASNALGTTEANNGVWWSFTTLPASQTIDDMRPSVRYNSWSGVSNTGASGGTYRVSKTAAASATFKFTGTAITWVTFKGPDQGKAQVTVDGVSKVFDLYSATPQWNVIKTISGLKNKAHTLVVKVLGTKNAKSRGRNVVVDAFVAASTTTQEDSPNVRYNAWTGGFDARASGSSYRASKTAGAVASLTFTGQSIDWITAQGPAYGKAQVIVDGKVKETVDLYAPTPKWQVVRSYTDLSATGKHTLQIKVLGTKRAASKGTTVVVDAFRGPVLTTDTAVQLAPEVEGESEE